MNTKKVVLFAIFILFAPVSLYCKGGRGGRGRSSASSSFSGGRNRVPPASHSSSQSAFNKPSFNPVQEHHVIHHHAPSAPQQNSFFSSFFGSAAGSYAGNRMAQGSHETNSNQSTHESTPSSSSAPSYWNFSGRRPYFAHSHQSPSNDQTNQESNDAELQETSNESSKALLYATTGVLGLIGARYAWSVWIKNYARRLGASTLKNALRLGR